MTSARSSQNPGAGRAALNMATGTLASRLTGFVRTVATVQVLGVGAVADAYNTANTTPNMVYALVTGGALGGILLPLLMDAKDADDQRRRAGVLGGLIFTMTAVAAVILALSSPLIARLLSSGEADPAWLTLTAALIAIFAAQVACYGASAFAVAVLNAHGRLGLAGAAPVITNIVVLAGIAGYAALADGPPPVLLDRPMWVLAVATTLGVAAMTALHVWGARRCLGRVRLTFAPRDPISRQLLKMGRWSLVFVVANQIGLAIVIRLANGIGSGGALTAYQYAFVMAQLPFAVIGGSLITAVAPALARHDSPERVARSLRNGLTLLTLTLALPSVLLAVMAVPTATLLLGSSGDDKAVALVAAPLACFALGLLPFAVVQLLCRFYYGRKDSRTPALNAVGVNVVMVVMASVTTAALSSELSQTAALALAWSGSYLLGAVVLALGCRRGTRGLFRPALRLTVSSCIAAVVVGAALGLAPQPAGGLFSTAAGLVGYGVAAVVAYALLVGAMAPRQLRALTGALRHP